MEIRKLTTLDVIKVANILKSEVLEALEKNKEDKKDYTKFGIELVGSVLEKAEKGDSEAFKWIASLVNMTAKELKQAPPATLLDIAEYLATSEEVKDFFTRAQQLSAKLKATSGN